MKKTTILPPAACPGCGVINTAATSFKGEQPEPGDITLCFSCGSINSYQENFSMKQLSDNEVAKMDPDLFATVMSYVQRIRNRSLKL